MSEKLNPVGTVDSHENRQREFELELHRIQERLASMDNIKDQDDFLDAVLVIRRSGLNLNGKKAEILDMISGYTVDEIKEKGKQKSLDDSGTLIYVVLQDFNTINCFVYKDGTEVEKWMYN